MKCKTCGAEIPEGMNFCTQCGAAAAREDGAQGQQGTASAPKNDPHSAAHRPTAAQAETASVREEVRAIWPDWEIVEKIGEGSFGRVYKAKREELGTAFYCAVKILRIPQNASEASSIRSEIGLDEASTTAYFKDLVNDCVNEIKLMEELKSTANVVGVEDYKVIANEGENAWSIYIRMELLESFVSYSAGRTLSEAEVLKLGIDICSALECCAKRNVMHRDIKPENIFVSDFGDFKLGDFGIARKLEKSSIGMSKKGTYNYMAPEIYNGSTDYDARSDIYSLGIVLYKLLNNNRFPLVDADADTVSYQQVQSAFDRRMKGEALPNPKNASEKVASVIRSACAYEPSRRFASAAVLKKALQRLQGEAVPATALNQTVAVGSKAEQPAAQTRAAVANQAVQAQPVRKPQPPEKQPQQPARKPTPPEQKAKKKKMAKWKKVLLTVGIVLLCGVVAAGVITYQWYNSAEQQILRAIDEGDYDKALEILEDDSEAGESSALISSLRERISAIRTDFENNEIEYTVAKMELSSIQKMNLEALSGELADTLSFIERVNESRTHFNTAEAFLASEDYVSAISQYQQVVEDDANYEAAKSQLAAAVGKYREQTLEKAAGFADAGDYPNAVSTLQAALAVLPEDAELVQQLEIYQSESAAKTRSDTLAAAEGYAKNADYLNAMKTIANLMSSADNDAELKTTYESYYNQYVSQVIASADAELAKKNYDEAAAIVNAGLKNASGDQLLTDKLNAINASKPLAITSLTPINSNGWENWNEGSPTDPFGNDYSTASNYVIIKNYKGTDYIEYRLYGKYSTLTGMIAPYTALEENASGYLQIYVDDELRYTSKDIGRKTDAFSFEIDVSGADYVKIAVTANNCWDYMIISNVMLWTE